MIGSAYSVYHIRIRLTQERWTHILEQHPEMAELSAQVLEAISHPELIVAGNNGELIAIKRLEEAKWLLVVYREDDDDGFVITAFTTRRYKALERRTVLWPPPKNT